ncbi:hypothetical protein M0P98_07605 [bacterium]|nr:hypothetical protein [bacterium]
MDKPFTRWYCDVCGKVIEDAKEGYVIWEVTEDGKEYNFQIIHAGKCRKKVPFCSSSLTDFLGYDGLTHLLSFLTYGPIKIHLREKSRCTINDFDGFVDFMRRVQTPFYEEARRYFTNNKLLERHCDDNEIGPYMQATLKSIIEKYGEHKDE